MIRRLNVVAFLPLIFLPWVALGILGAAGLLASGCGPGHQSIAVAQCEQACGGAGEVCEYKGGDTGGGNEPDGVCVCRSKDGTCPDDDAGAGAQP